MRQNLKARGAGPVLVLAAATALLSIGLSGCDKFNEGFNKGFNEKFDKDTHDSCVKSSAGNGVFTSGGAERYCTCVVQQLDKLTVQQKMSLNAQSPEIQQVANTCVAQSSPTQP